jgi:hypothetical protein
MLTTGILIGFALMLLAPCLVALIGSRNEEKVNAAYADRTVDEAVPTLPVKRDAASARAMAAEAKECAKPAPKPDAKPEAKPEAAPVAKKLEERLEMTDPRPPKRGLKSHDAMLEWAELEVVKAKAISARAHAETLAAIARAAAAKAEVAAAEADLAEEAAMRVIREMWKAA